MEVGTLKFEKNNEKEEIIFEREKVAKVNVSFHYDLHGDLLSIEGFNGKKTYDEQNANVKLIKRTFEAFGSKYEIWDLFVNGTAIQGECISYKYLPDSNTFKAKLVVGAG